MFTGEICYSNLAFVNFVHIITIVRCYTQGKTNKKWCIVIKYKFTRSLYSNDARSRSSFYPTEEQEQFE